MRLTRIIAATALAAAAFATTPAAAHHPEAVCHGSDDVWLGPFAGVDNPTTGPQQGGLACVYIGGSTYIVGVSREVSTGHSCISIYYGISSAFLGCYL